MVNLFKGPNMIEDVASTMRRLEDGDLKLRVRALDSERALTRVLVRFPPCWGAVCDHLTSSSSSSTCVGVRVACTDVFQKVTQ